MAPELVLLTTKKHALFEANTGKTSEISGFISGFSCRQTIDLFHQYFELIHLNQLTNATPQAVRFGEMALQFRLDDENECSNAGWLIANYEPSTAFTQMRSKYVNQTKSLVLAEKFCDYE